MLDTKIDWVAKRGDLRTTAEAMLSSVGKLPVALVLRIVTIDAWT